MNTVGQHLIDFVNYVDFLYEPNNFAKDKYLNNGYERTIYDIILFPRGNSIFRNLKNSFVNVTDAYILGLLLDAVNKNSNFISMDGFGKVVRKIIRINTPNTSSYAINPSTYNTTMTQVSSSNIPSYTNIVPTKSVAPSSKTSLYAGTQSFNQSVQKNTDYSKIIDYIDYLFSDENYSNDTYLSSLENEHDGFISFDNVQRFQAFMKLTKQLNLNTNDTQKILFEISKKCKNVIVDHDYQRLRKKESVSRNWVIDVNPKNDRNVNQMFGEEAFSLMTYNILAPSLVGEDRYKQDKKVLGWYHRSKKIINQIQQYQPDIVCLQEVTLCSKPNKAAQSIKIMASDSLTKSSNPNLVQELQSINQEPMFLFNEMFKKNNYGSDQMIRNVKFDCTLGMVCSWNNNKFKHLMTHKHTLNELIQGISKNDSTLLNMANQSKQDAMFVVLQPTHYRTSRDIVIVCCVHLAPPNKQFEHLALVQSHSIITHMNKLKLYYEKSYNSVRCLMAGDFNTTPQEITYDFLTMNSITKHPKAQTVNPMLLTNPLPMKSSYYSTSKREMYSTMENSFDPNTLKTSNFNGSLDYIFFDPKNVKVLSVLQKHDPNFVEKQGRMPSEIFPSDHMPLMAIFK